MGWQPEETVYHINYEEYPGLSIRATATDLGTFAEISNTSMNARDQAQLKKVYTAFIECVVSWNIEHPIPKRKTADGMTCARCTLQRGVDLPISVDSLYCLNTDLVQKLIVGWMVGISRVSVPKGVSTLNGDEIQEDLMRQLAKLQNPTELHGLNFS